ncbi:MAG: hypothetical protein WEA24_18040 [Gemmatimonadota bacterium]
MRVMSPGARGRLAAVFLLAIVAGCARAVSIGTDPSPVSRVEVRNATTSEVNVFYTFAEGQAERALGNVPAGGTEEFVIAGASGRSVSIIGRTTSGQRSYGPYVVELEAGTTGEVVIGPT